MMSEQFYNDNADTLSLNQLASRIREQFDYAETEIIKEKLGQRGSNNFGRVDTKDGSSMVGRESQGTGEVRCYFLEIMEQEAREQYEQKQKQR